MRQPLNKSFEPILVRLGLANLYGWTAFTIFDDFLDDEGQTEFLPAATAALRYSLASFGKALPNDAAFQDFVQQTFDAIDSANAWELAHCRFRRRGSQLVVTALPVYSLVKLADRSLGHSLTPLAVLRAQGVSLDDKLFQDVRQALVHYLAAKQINDDVHDWQTDLQKGHATYVVTHILADAQIKPGSYTWGKLLPMAQRQFWHHTLAGICRDIRRQIDLSRRSLSNLPQLQSSNVINSLLDNIEASVVDTLDAQHQARAFLQHYRSGVKAVA